MRTIAFAALLVLGCDPQGPGASGTIRIGPSVDITSYRTLVVRAFPAPGGAFDPARALLQGEAKLIEPAGSFPRPYEVSTGVGTTDYSEWLVVAWLSRRSDGPFETIEAGDAFGTQLFTLSSCSNYSGYCRVKSGVDCTIDRMR